MVFLNIVSFWNDNMKFLSGREGKVWVEAKNDNSFNDFE